jgi:hypothetical protein
MISLVSAHTARRVWRTLSRPARNCVVLGIGVTLGAGGLALGDIATSPEGTPSGTVLTCTGKLGAMRYVRHGGCQRGETRLVLADSAPLIVSLPNLSGNQIAESPGVSVSGPAVGTYRVQVSARTVRDVRRCAYIATPTVALQGGEITHAAQAVVAPANQHVLLVRVFDDSGNLSTDGVSLEIYCP